MIRVLIVDDLRLVRETIRLFLEHAQDTQVIGEARDGQEGLEMAARLAPDVVVMDIEMPRLNGLDATAALHTREPKLPILIFAMSSDEADVRRAVQNGARGYVPKDGDYTELLAAIRVLAAGQTYLSRVITK
ncbi:MAG: response regulator transcription factor [Chloroflexi bacterium]|nr:response regulator transcription factor [Chloroflexota bacterium]